MRFQRVGIVDGKQFRHLVGVVGPVVGLVGVDLHAVARIEGVAAVLHPEGDDPGEHIDKFLPGVRVQLRDQRVRVAERHQKKAPGQKIKRQRIVAEYALNDLRADHILMGGKAVDNKTGSVLSTSVPTFTVLATVIPYSHPNCSLILL